MVHFVFCGRNDTHGGGSFGRKLVQILQWNHRIFDTVGLDHFFWFIEWGQEPGRPWLAPELTRKFSRLRAIMVPNDLVAAAHVPPVRFQEFTAKNIGLSRAGDGLVVATNSDILFPPELAGYLKALKPDDSCVYRAPRHDFKNETILPRQKKDFVWVRKYTVGSKFNEAAGDFTAATPAAWERIGGYCESLSHMRNLDSEVVTRAVSLGLAPVQTPPVYHKEHPESTHHLKLWRWEWGIHEPGFDDNTHIFGRSSTWGHRDHLLTVEADNLFMLHADCWESEVRVRTDLNHESDVDPRKGGSRCRKICR